MASKNSEIKVDYKVINTAFNNGIKEMKGEVTTLNKQFALQKEQMKLSATESEKLEANIEKLNKEYENAQKQTRMTETAYENVISIMGEGSKEAQTWSNKLLDAQKNEAYLENAIQEKTVALEKSNEATRKAAQEQEKLETNTKRLETLFEATETTLDDYVDVLGTRMVSAIRAGEASSDQLELAINKIGKTAIDTEIDLSELKRTLDKVDDEGNIDEVRADIKQMGESADDASPKLEEMTDVLRGEALLEASEHLKDISDKIIDVGKDAIEAAATVRASDAQFEQVFGSAEAVADDAVDSMSNSFGILPSRLRQPFAATTSMFLGLGVDIDTAMGMSTDALTIAADSAAFYDRSLEDTQGSLNSFLKGNYEGGEAIGIFANETQMAAYAIKNDLIEATEEQQKHAETSALAVEKAQDRYSKAVEKHGEGSLEARDALSKLNDEIEKQENGPDLTTKWSKLNEAQKQSVRLNYAKYMQEQSGAMGQAAREADGYENIMANLDAIIEEFMATIGEPALEMFLDLVESLIPLIEQAAQWFMNLNPNIQQFIVILLGVTAAVGALLPIILAIKGAMLMFGASFAPVIAAIIAVIGIISAIVYAILNWEQVLAMIQQAMIDWGIIFQNVWNGIYEFGVSILTTIGSYFITKWNEIKDGTGETWDGIKTSVIDKALEIYNGIKENFGNAWTTVQTIWNNISNYVTDKINAARDAVRDAINAIKGFLNFEWKWPKIPIPKIVQTGSARVFGMDIPRFGIEWNAKGGIFNQPSIIGHYGGNLQGVGEAGPEAVIPLNHSVLASIGAGISQTMNNDEVVERLEALIELEERILEKETYINMIMNEREVARGISTPLHNYNQTIDDRGGRMRGEW